MEHSEIDFLEANPDYIYALAKTSDVQTFIAANDWEVNPGWTFPTGEITDPYDQLILHPDLLAALGGSKPAKLELANTTWAIHIAALRADENFRLAEISRIAAIKSRWNALPDPRSNMVKMGDSRANPAMLLKEIIDNDSTTILDTLESHNTTVTAEKAFAKAVVKGHKKLDLGRHALAMFAGMMDDDNLTPGLARQMLNDLNTSKGLLEAGAIHTAIDELNTMAKPANVQQADIDGIKTYLIAEIARIDSEFA